MIKNAQVISKELKTVGLLLKRDYALLADLGSILLKLTKESFCRLLSYPDIKKV
jgi:hypothetical protein